MAKAGRRLGLLPPRRRRAFWRGLEDRLGVRLLQRTIRSLHPTKPGHRFGDAAKRLLEDMETVKREAAGTGLAPQGRVAITASTGFGRQAVVPLFAEFLADHRRLTGSVQLWNRNANPVKGGIDVAVRIGPRPEAELMRGVADAGGQPTLHGRLGRAKNDADALNYHRIIAFCGVMPTVLIALGRFSRAVSPWIELSDAVATLALAEDGHGVTLKKNYLATSCIVDSSLVEAFPELSEPALSVLLVLPEARLPMAAVRAFIDKAQPKLAARPA